jgi:energy-coupling factor transport system ATP-binding protein
MIEVRNLHVRYPEAHALRGVSLTVEAGDFVLIGGPSGGGKSTLAHTLLGLIPQTTPAEVEGHISVAGLDPRQHSVAQIAAHVGLVFQNPATQLFNGTVEEEVAFGPRNLGLPPHEIASRVEYALEATGGVYLRGRSVRHLSSGEQQRVTIAAALALRPAALILDEPSANLDSAGVQQLVHALIELHQAGVTLIVIEHRLAPFLPHADRLVWLEDGTASPLPSHPPFPSPSFGGGEGRRRGNRVRAFPRPLVTLQRITAGYDGRAVLQECSLTLCEGEFAALIGPNGAGKTTLARVLAGLMRPHRGSHRGSHRGLHRGKITWHVDGRKSRVGLLQQNPRHQLVCDTVEKEVNFGPRNLGIEQVEELETMLAEADLLSLRRRPTRALSVGQQQRTALAATLALRPSLLILDEPTVGQDWHHLTQMMDFVSELNRQGQTVLLITHDRELVDRYAGRVWEMKEGKTQEAGDRAG